MLIVAEVFFHLAGSVSVLSYSGDPVADVAPVGELELKKTVAVDAVLAQDGGVGGGLRAELERPLPDLFLGYVALGDDDSSIFLLSIGSAQRIKTEATKG